MDFSGIKVIESPDFAGMPVGAVRDQNELTLVERGGETWVRVSDALFSPASSAPSFEGGTRSVILGEDGCSEWLRTGADLILNFEKPAKSRVLVFSPEGSPVYDSVLEKGAVYAEKGSFIEFAGNPGDALKIRGR